MEQYFAVADWWNSTSAEWRSAVLKVLFSCLLDFTDPLPQITLSGLTAAHGESYGVEMPKAALWKPCSEIMPVRHFTNECHSHPSSCQDARRCREPAAPAGAHSQEQCDGDNDIDRAMCRGAAAPRLLACSTPCAQLVLMWKQKPEQPHFATPQREASLRCGCSALLKNKCTAEKGRRQTCTFFLSQGLWMFQVQSMWHFGFIWKSLRTRIVRYN